jgi:hypothetical protein
MLYSVPPHTFNAFGNRVGLRHHPDLKGAHDCMGTGSSACPKSWAGRAPRDSFRHAEDSASCGRIEEFSAAARVSS